MPLVLGTYVARWPADPGSGVTENWINGALARGRDAISALQQRQADTLVLTTPAAGNRLPNAKGVRDRIHFLPHGVDTELFSPAAHALKREAVEDQEYPSILFFANVAKRKGIFTLIDAFPAVANEFPHARLRIAGDGPDLPEVKRRVGLLGCAHQVEFLGQQERKDAPAFFRNCSVYCLPSFGEPYATTIIEAMSCGKPIVCTDSGGSPHLVPAEGGKCVPAGDSAALSLALRDLLRDPHRRATMGHHNRELVKSTMSWDHVAEELEEIYEKTIQKSSTTRHGGRRSEELSLDHISGARFQERV